MRRKGSGSILWALLAALTGTSYIGVASTGAVFAGAERALTGDLSGVLPGEACDDIRERRAASVGRYTDALVRVAMECAERGLRDEGAAMIEKVVQLHTPERNSKPWPSTGAPPETAPGEIVDETALPRAVRVRIRAARDALARTRSRLDSTGDRLDAVRKVADSERRARRDFVNELSRLANRCVDDGFPALGYEVVLWTLQYDPDNARLRKALRQKPWTDERSGETRWYAPFDHAHARSGEIDDPRYGWVTPDDLQRLRSGEVRFDAQWLPKGRVEKLRRHWSGRWKHETEHFVIHTNADREGAVRFGREIERFYSFLFRVLVDFYAFEDPAEAIRLVLRRGKDLGRRKLRLHYHRSRESYLSEIETDPLLRAAGRALTTQSAGFYWGQNGRAYFYAGPRGPDVTTVFHEVTHQILGETYPTVARPPAWLVEGIAVFMESAVVRGQCGTERLLVGAKPPPGVISVNRASNINAFIRNLGTTESFHAGRRHEHYATAGAIVHFFLLHRDGLLRRPFIRYAREAHQNDLPEEPTPIGTLYNYLDLTEDELQVEWEAFHVRPGVFDF